jgi:hypothetical protein
MDFLTINTTPVPVEGVRGRSIKKGTTTRSYDKTLRSTEQPAKEEWELTTPPLAPAAVAFLKGLAPAIVTVNGMIVEGVDTSCLLTVNDFGYVVELSPDGGVTPPITHRALGLLLQQV